LKLVGARAGPARRRVLDDQRRPKRPKLFAIDRRDRRRGGECERSAATAWRCRVRRSYRNRTCGTGAAAAGGCDDGQQEKRW